MPVLVREKPPLALTYELTTPTGASFRFADDERRPGNRPGGESFGDAMPGGFDDLSGLTLSRSPRADYGDTGLLSTIRARGAGGFVAWEGRLASVPDFSGDEMGISPAAEGFQAHLADDQSAAEIFVDVDLNNWGGLSLARQAAFYGLGYTAADASVISDPDVTLGKPALDVGFDGAWVVNNAAEGWYDALGIPIGSLFTAWQKSANVGAAAPWAWSANLTATDSAPPGDGAVLTGAGPGTNTLNATTNTRVFAFLQFTFAGAGGAADYHYTIYFTEAAVYGRHGLTLYGTADATHAKGVLASDVIAYTVRKYAPLIAIADSSGFTPTNFVIPHLIARERGTAADILSAANRFHVRPWAVWEGPTMYYHERTQRGRYWRALSGPSKLSQTGPALSRLFNGVLVRYTDVTGATRTVGPPGSGAYFTSSALLDSDTTNPANAVSIRKWAMLDMSGTATPSGAVQVGQQFLAEQKALDSSGQAELDGYAIDEHGIIEPYWKVRSGDWIAFTDARDTSYRWIAKTSKSPSARSVSLDLDAPADGMADLLERLQVVLVPLGFG